MLNELFKLSRPFVCLDIESTGLNPKTDRIIELGFQVFRPDGSIDEWRSLINPGVPIPPASTAVHHIYDDDMLNCRKCWIGAEAHPTRTCPEFVVIPKFVQVAQKLARGFSDCDFGGKNIRFDLGFLAEEFARANVPWSYAGAYIIDADRLESLAEPRNLAALHKKYVGMEHDDAHSALSDVRATATVIVKQLERHVDALPRDLKRLHELSWPNFIDSAGKFRMQDGKPYIMFGKHKGTLMDKVPSDYWTWIVGADFDGEVKRIAGEAAKGVFPK